MKKKNYRKYMNSIPDGDGFPHGYLLKSKTKNTIKLGSQKGDAWFSSCLNKVLLPKGRLKKKFTESTQNASVQYLPDL